jgi:hypothetical protein
MAADHGRIKIDSGLIEKNIKMFGIFMVNK